MATRSVGRVCSDAPPWRRKAPSSGKAFLDGLKSGPHGGRSSRLAQAASISSRPRSFGAGQIVHDDNVARPKLPARAPE